MVLYLARFVSIRSNRCNCTQRTLNILSERNYPLVGSAGVSAGLYRAEQTNGVVWFCKSASQKQKDVRTGQKELSMTVNQKNRSHRIAYMVALLVFAVALTTVLVLAAERASGTENGTPTSQKADAPATQILVGC